MNMYYYGTSKSSTIFCTCLILFNNLHNPLPKKYFDNMRQVQPEMPRRTVIFLPVYKISNLKITPPKTPNSGQLSYPLPNIVSFLFVKKSTRVPV
jgi:hypothetical protein